MFDWMPETWDTAHGIHPYNGSMLCMDKLLLLYTWWKEKNSEADIKWCKNLWQKSMHWPVQHTLLFLWPCREKLGTLSHWITVLHASSNVSMVWYLHQRKGWILQHFVFVEFKPLWLLSWEWKALGWGQRFLSCLVPQSFSHKEMHRGLH